MMIVVRKNSKEVNIWTLSHDLSIKFLSSKIWKMRDLISSRGPREMFTNLSLFARLFVVWFVIGKVRSDIYVTKITRDLNDIFTNGFCGKCGEFAAKEEGNSTCRCNASRTSRSIFMRSERKCKPVTELPVFKSKLNSVCVILTKFRIKN